MAVTDGRKSERRALVVMERESVIFASVLPEKCDISWELDAAQCQLSGMHQMDWNGGWGPLISVQSPELLPVYCSAKAD